MDLQGSFHVYDTTLRDGAQQEGLNLSVADKLSIARQLDGLGVGYIEGGWPGANPKDTEFFRRAVDELDLRHARLAAFGATRRAGMRAADDPLIGALRDSGASVVTLVAKSHDRHVELALRTTLEENLSMIRDTVTHLREEGQTVFLDAEHFFDGYRANRAYALEVLRTAYDAGAEVVALCDTNGGMLPGWVGDVVHDVVSTTGVRVGIHCHNDTGCAVANSLAAVDAGATHVQGTINGYGERTGNADLVSVVANLELKLDRQVLPQGLLRDATRIAHAVAEVTNVPPASRQPYVGTSAFAHKAGLHASAIKVDPSLYQHMDPVGVGNDMRLLVSDMAGRASIELKGRELGFDLGGDRDLVTRVTARVKEMEALRAHVRGRGRVLRAVAHRGGRGRPAGVLRHRVVAGHHRLHARRRGGLGGDGQAARGRRPLRRHRRGQRTGQRARRGAADGDPAGLPRGREVRADRLQGPHPRPGPRHRRDHPRAHRDLRRRVDLGDGRRRRQRDRGVVGCADRRAHFGLRKHHRAERADRELRRPDDPARPGRPSRRTPDRRRAPRCAPAGRGSAPRAGPSARRRAVAGRR